MRVIDSPAREIARRDLLAGLEACDARVYRFIAGAGFGKSTLAWELARKGTSSSLCDLLGVRSDTDAWRRLMTALAELAPDGRRMAQESLTLSLAGPDERNTYLHSIAERTELRGALVIENAEHLADTTLLAPVRAVLAGRPSCSVIICSRTDLPLELAKNYTPHEFVTVRERDLRFTLADFRQLLGTSARDDRAERALAWSAGWPLAAARAIALLGRGDQLPQSSASETWLRDLIAETIAGVALEFREALFRLAAIAGPTLDEIFPEGTPETRKHAREQLVATVPFIAERPDGSLELHALAREELLRAFADDCRRAGETVVADAMARNDHLRCAELALQQDDAEVAADALVRADHDFYQMPSSRYVTVLERLNRDIVLARPALWMVSEICLKSDFLALNRELEPVFRAKAHTLSPRTRMACAALVCFRRGEYDGRWEESLALLEEFERTFASDCVWPKDLLYAAHYRCGAASNEGVEFDGAAHWRDYGEELASAPIFHGESLYWEATRSYFRNDAAGALSAIERYVDHVRSCGYPIYRRASLFRSLFTCWELDARELLDRYRRELVGLLTEPTTPNDLVARLAWEVLDATTGVPPYRDGPILSTDCLLNLILAAHADDFDVVEAALNQALTLSGSPALRVANVKLSVAAFCFDPAAHERLLDSAFTTFSGSAAPALRECVRRLRDGESGGILDPFAARFSAAGERHRNTLFIDVTLARARRDGVEIHLGDREFELLMLLAAAGRAVPALELAEMLWPDSDDAAARNALKVCISRIRSRVGCKEAIVTSGGDVCLSPTHVQTDLARAHRLLRLAHEGSAAALHAARAVLDRPVPQRYASSRTGEAIAAHWKRLTPHL